MKILILLSLGFAGCVTPTQWKQEQQNQGMQQCRLMCGEKRTLRYIPSTGECVCRNPRRALK